MPTRYYADSIICTHFQAHSGRRSHYSGQYQMGPGQNTPPSHPLPDYSKVNDKTLKPRPAKRYSHLDPSMGLDLLAVFTYGVIKDKLLDTASTLVQNYGYTVAYGFIGKPGIANFEPRNIRELLSTRFRD